MQLFDHLQGTERVCASEDWQDRRGNETLQPSSQTKVSSEMDRPMCITDASCFPVYLYKG